MLLENDLPKGIHQLGEATKASSGEDALFTGQVPFSGNKVVYQLSGKDAAEHPCLASAELEAKGEKTVNGRSYTVAYANGKGMASNAQMTNVAQPRVTSRGHGVST